MSQKVYLEVAIDSLVRQEYTYCSDRLLAPGHRVVVPFGRSNKHVHGTVLRHSKEVPNYKVKAIIAAIGDGPALSEVMLKLGRWLSEYYLYPLGLVYKAMLPVQEKVIPLKWCLTEEGRKHWSDKASEHHQAVRSLFPKRVAVADATVNKRLAGLGDLSLEELIQLGIVAQECQKDDSLSNDKSLTPNSRLSDKNFTLTEEQKKAVETIFSKFLRSSLKPTLLWGVTGSGKTEVYLNLIERIFDNDPSAQALVMVPEISLTPQMTYVFECRFPKKVLTVHSSMDDKIRYERLKKIGSGVGKILLGPRSSIFGSFNNLKLIIVDEEHDSSYKQESGLHYNGRDVAVLRGHLEKAQVLLGSATPSLESYGNVQLGKYTLVEMPTRVQKRPLPEIKLVPTNIKKNMRTLNASLAHVAPTLGADLIRELENNLALGQQSIVIVNRKGYAHFVLSLKDNQPICCPDCSVSLTVYSRQDLLRCHYCDFSRPIRPLVESNEEYVIVGCGSEQLEAQIRECLPNARVARVDANSVSRKGLLEETLAKFRSQEVDILVGTQILAKGHDFSNVTLICLLEVDQMLSLPDFRAGEKLIQLVIQAAGRAGRGELSGRVLLQSQMGSDPVLSLAATQNYKSFLRDELKLRANNGFPPFKKLISFEYSCVNQSVLSIEMEKLATYIEQLITSRPAVLESISFLGPNTPPIEKVRGRHRRFLLLSAASSSDAWPIARWLQKQSSQLSNKVRLVVNVDPQNLF